MANKKEFDLVEVERLASLGLSEEQIGLALGVSRATISRNKADDTFAAALKKGRASGIAHVANKLREQVDSGSVAATIFTLKAKAGWSESAEIERRIDELEQKLKGERQ